MRGGCLGACLVLLVAGEAGAHGRSVSHSVWWMEPTGARVEARVAARDIAFRGIGDVPAYVTTHLRLAAGGRPCVAGTAHEMPSAPGWMRFAWHVECPAAPDRLDNDLFLDGPSARLHFARVERREGTAIQRVFGPQDVALPLPRIGDERDTGDIGHSLGRYVALGIEHIVTGWDHLAFLAGLLVLAAGMRDVLVLATGFTVAHSVTLALSVLGLVRPSGPAVEALIGFSILLVAVENVWLAAGRGRLVPGAMLAGLGVLAVLRIGGHGALTLTTVSGLLLFTAAHFGLLAIGRRPERLRAAVAFGFGLMHGFGFAGILQEVALPPDVVVPALFGFNMGVELGQLGAILVAWPVLILLRRMAGERPVTEAASAALAGLGAFWFVGRAFGG